MRLQIYMPEVPGVPENLCNLPSERLRDGISSVAGVQPPAFVERWSSLSSTSKALRVSPGFNLRPSLSGSAYPGGRCRSDVSPGFNLRPSLSVHGCGDSRP